MTLWKFNTRTRTTCLTEIEQFKIFKMSARHRVRWERELSPELKQMIPIVEGRKEGRKEELIRWPAFVRYLSLFQLTNQRLEFTFPLEWVQVNAAANYDEETLARLVGVSNHGTVVYVIGSGRGGGPWKHQKELVEEPLNWNNVPCYWAKLKTRARAFISYDPIQATYLYLYLCLHLICIVGSMGFLQML